jgi:hypothetical protein
VSDNWLLLLIDRSLNWDSLEGSLLELFSEVQFLLLLQVSRNTQVCLAARHDVLGDSWSMRYDLLLLLNRTGLVLNLFDGRGCGYHLHGRWVGLLFLVSIELSLLHRGKLSLVALLNVFLEVYLEPCREELVQNRSLVNVGIHECQMASLNILLLLLVLDKLPSV